MCWSVPASLWDGRFTLQERRRPQQFVARRRWGRRRIASSLSSGTWNCERCRAQAWSALERIAGGASVANNNAAIDGCGSHDSGRTADAKNSIVTIVPGALHGIAGAGFAADGAMAGGSDLKR